MDEQTIRLNALMIAEKRIAQSAPLPTLISAAEKIAAYIKTGTTDQARFWNADELERYRSPISFVEETIHILHPTKGVVPIKLFEYQKTLLDTYKTNRMVVVNAARQIGVTTTTFSYVWWYALFNINKTILMVCSATARQRMYDKMCELYDHCTFSQHDNITTRNRDLISLINGSRIFFRDANENSGLGMSVHLLVINDAAYIPHKTAKEFWTAIRPALAQTMGHVIMVSDPGVSEGLFYNTWMNTATNGFVPVELPYSVHPEYDEAWEEHQRSFLGEERFRRNFECKFQQP